MVDYLSGRDPSANFLNAIRPGLFGKAFSETAVTTYVKEDSEYIEIKLYNGLTVLSIAAQVLLFFFLFI